ncbi:hypothetical protein L21SP5_01923 [Salinivirga cyanobacteriivorans]|uniref:PAP2 superfamily protein n=1 Tax=Salinivirga cyanobacteriivorans TaxID=1307839 RepID=A0A0S2HZS8_9BACT|nr:hypothetical protein [Salinivirga cyanobacteriivorans]ALO15562.1 hypothetical protein L21SP5_01923 [Salinivirga cyanobacteriivorans]
MLKQLAKAISIIFHPVLMPTLGLFVIFSSSYYMSMMPQKGQDVTYLIVFVSTFLLPVIMMSLFLLRKVIKSFEMTQTQERFVPFLVTAIFYFFSFFTLHRLNAPGFISSYIFGAFVIVFFISIITVKWKISAHAAGLGGMIGMILALSDLYHAHNPHFFIQAIVAAGLVGTARLFLGAHTIKQIAGGFALGFVVMLTTIYLYPI